VCVCVCVCEVLSLEEATINALTTKRTSRTSVLMAKSMVVTAAGAVVAALFHVALVRPQAGLTIDSSRLDVSTWKQVHVYSSKRSLASTHLCLQLSSRKLH
jgi:hypothetical protein